MPFFFQNIFLLFSTGIVLLFNLNISRLIIPDAHIGQIFFPKIAQIVQTDA